MEMKLRGSYTLRPEDSHEIGPTPRCRIEGWMFQFPACTRTATVVWWVPACLPAWREDEVIAAGLLAPGFQLSARAETAVAEALARDQPHTLQPFLARCYTGALAAWVGIVRWWWGEEGKNWEKLLGAATPIMCGGARAA